MKRYILLLLVTTVGVVQGQDVFREKLFSVDLILKYAEDIALSDQQEASVKKIYNDHISEFNSLKWELDAQMVKMDRLISTDQVDNEAALKKMDHLLDLENKLKKMRFKVMLALKSQLTETQQEQLKGLRSSSDGVGLNMMTPINENPRVMLKVDGPKSAGDPLYIIKDQYGQRRANSVSGIEPADIESVEVIKGEMALDEYGQDGKNGVIIVTLKSRL